MHIRAYTCIHTHTMMKISTLKLMKIICRKKIKFILFISEEKVRFIFYFCLQKKKKSTDYFLYDDTREIVNAINFMTTRGNCKRHIFYDDTRETVNVINLLVTL